MAVTLAVEGSGAVGQGTLIETAIVPAFLAGLVAIAANGLAQVFRQPQPDSVAPESTGSEPSDGDRHEPVDSDSDFAGAAR